MRCPVTFVLEHVIHHLLKHGDEASSRGHKARSRFVMSRNHVTVSWNSFMHSEHSCGARRRVWRALTNLVTGGLQPWCSSSLMGVRRRVNFPDLVAAPYALRELCGICNAISTRTWYRDVSALRWRSCSDLLLSYLWQSELLLFLSKLFHYLLSLSIHMY